MCRGHILSRLAGPSKHKIYTPLIILYSIHHSTILKLLVKIM